MSEHWQLAIFVGLIAAFLIFRRLGQIGRDDAHRLVKEGATLIDVRSASEFSGGHIAGAINIPLGALAGEANKLGAKDKPVIVYCASGTRSAMARSQLKALGFTQVFNLGSMGRWY